MQKEYENKTREIEVKITDYYSSSLLTQRAILITKQRTLYALEAVKLAMLRFKYGKGIMLDIIQAQSEMTQARAQYIETIIKYNISQLSLLFETAQMTKEKIIENYKP